MITPTGLVTNPRQTPLATKQDPQAKKASRCLHDRRPSRQPPSPMGLATPFFRHLARPRAAEMLERTRVVKNSISPSVKVPLPKMMFLRLASSNPVAIISKLYSYSYETMTVKSIDRMFLLALTMITVIIRAVGADSKNTSCSPMFWSNSFFSFFPFTGSL